MKKSAPATDEAKPSASDEMLIEARKAYDRCREAWADNHDAGREDLKFARLGEQWDTQVENQRRLEGRPCLTFNKMPSFIRQVVNDARQNKPSIKVHPADSGADPRTAEIINGLIRNIETTSDADVAYDTAIESAVDKGFGFFRINTAYTCDDAFDQDIVIERINNPFTVYGDPSSTAADSSDWNVAFVATTLTRDEFEREYPDADRVDWDHDFRDAPDWLNGDNVTVAEWWTREKVKSEIVALSDGTVVKVDEVEERADELQAAGIEIVGEPREVESWKVTQRIMSGAEVLKTVEWAGKYIPIVAVYGDEVTDEDGKRWFRSLIRDAKGAQQMFNYMRTTGVEGLALQPRVPYIGKKGTFDGDPNWLTANQVSHAYLEYENEMPQRQPLPSHFGAAFQEALSASDDMKSIIGIYDAGLGARSNETSGRAIRARKMESDVSTFHFIDNLSRAIRHAGRILIDLIPKVYSTERMVRVLGEDLKPQNVQLAPTGQPVQEVPTNDGMHQVYDITAGKYDLTVKAGPSFGTQREEAKEEIVEIIRSVPEAAAVLGPMYLRNSDWPGADEAADKLEGKGQQQGLPPEVQQQMQQGMQLIQQQGAKIQELEQDAQGKAVDRQIKMQELKLKEQEVQNDAYRAETERMSAVREATQPTIYRPATPQ